MPILKNARHERFVQALAKGMANGEAWVAAGHDTDIKSGAVSANRVLKNKAVRDRLEELLARRNEIDVRAVEKAVEKLAITKENVLRELVKLGFSNTLDYVRVDQYGEAVIDLSKMTRDQAAAIQEITSEIYMEGTGEDAKPVKRTKVKFYDKKSALVEIGKELGMFVRKLEVGGPGDFASLTEDELLALEDEISEKIEEINTSGVTHSGSGAVN